MGTYRRPTSLAAALDILAANRCRVLAGGTDLYPADVAARAWGQRSAFADDLLDVGAVAELRGIAVGRSGIRLGATTTWRELAEAGLPPACAGLALAAGEIGGRQIQARGTLGGNLCNASPAADGFPPLLTLDAEVELASIRGTRRLPLQEFVLGSRRTALAADELLVAIHLPRPPDGARGAFAKLGARRYLVISIVMVAVVGKLDDAGSIAHVRVAVGACAPVARRLVSLEAELVGLTPRQAARAVTAAHLYALEPIDDVRATAAYRLRAAEVLVARALTSLAALERAA